MKVGTKRTLAALLAFAMIALFAVGCSEKKDEAPVETPPEGEGAPVEIKTDYEGATLVVATWGWTAQNVAELSKAFEEKYNCTVVIDETSGNADRLNKIIAQKDKPEIDVALLSQSFAVIGNNQDLFEKINPEIVTGLDKLYDFALDPDGYGPCYSVVRYGIIYNADLVEEPASYQDLFTDKYAGMLSLPDMASTAGPYLLIALAESLGGDQNNVDAAFELMSANKDNVVQFYSTSSDVQTAFTAGEIGVSVFMDMNMPALRDAGLNVGWVTPEEGAFSAAATVNVVKNCANPELAQLYVDYLISTEVQNQIADQLSEAPTNKEATMSEEKQAYLSYGEEAAAELRVFDYKFIDAQKAEWIERFQKEVAI